MLALAVDGDDLTALDNGAYQVLRHAIAELAVVGDVEQQQVGLFADFEAADARALPDGVRDAGEWYATDALGSVRLTLDDSGAVRGNANYDPWGSIENSSIDTFGFTGELQRGDQVYLRARWYNAGYGTFISHDTWPAVDARPSSLHPYAYVENDPINAIDPTGYRRYRIWAAAFIAFDEFEFLHFTNFYEPILATWHGDDRSFTDGSMNHTRPQSRVWQQMVTTQPDSISLPNPVDRLHQVLRGPKMKKEGLQSQALPLCALQQQTNPKNDH